MNTRFLLETPVNMTKVLLFIRRWQWSDCRDRASHLSSPWTPFMISQFFYRVKAGIYRAIHPASCVKSFK